MLLLAACTLPSVAPSEPSAAEPPGLVYEIYVRSFQDTDGDGIGDLAGVTSRLDYLEWLGVETLWLMPIFAADAVAGYGVIDHFRVEPDYGREEDLIDLLEAAHERGMRVILDVPINHVSVEHPWFAQRDRMVIAEEQYDTYRWFPTGDGTFYYAFFGAHLPDLDWNDPIVHDEMFGMLTRWQDLGVDGFRIDAAGTLIESAHITGTPETHALLAEMNGVLHENDPNAWIVAEAAEPEVVDNLEYLGGADSVLDFPRQAALLDAIQTGDVSGLRAVLAEEGDAPVASFLGSHDVSRLASTIPDERARRALFAALLTLPGTPVLYYGEELDLPDSAYASGQDYAWRAPMAWDATGNAGFTTAVDAWLPPDPSCLEGWNVADEMADPESMLTWVRGLVALDLDGQFELLPSEDGFLKFRRGDVEVSIQFAAPFAVAVDGGAL